MKLLSIPEIRALNGQEVTSTGPDCRISVGSTLLILRKTGQRPHILSATSRYPSYDVPPELDGAPLLFAGSRRGLNPEEDPDDSRYAFPMWTMEGLIYVPRWCDIIGDALVAVAEVKDGESRAGGWPMDWEMAWREGHKISSTSVMEVG